MSCYKRNEELHNCAKPIKKDQYQTSQHSQNGNAKDSKKREVTCKKINIKNLLYEY